MHPLTETSLSFSVMDSLFWECSEMQYQRAALKLCAKHMALVPKQTYIKDVIDQIKMFPNHNHVILVLSQHRGFLSSEALLYTCEHPPTSHSTAAKCLFWSVCTLVCKKIFQVLKFVGNEHISRHVQVKSGLIFRVSMGCLSYGTF